MIKWNPYLRATSMASFGFVFSGWLGILLFFILELGWSTLGQHPRQLQGPCNDFARPSDFALLSAGPTFGQSCGCRFTLWRRCPGRLGTASRALHDLKDPKPETERSVPLMTLMTLWLLCLAPVIRVSWCDCCWSIFTCQRRSRAKKDSNTYIH